MFFGAWEGGVARYVHGDEGSDGLMRGAFNDNDGVRSERAGTSNAVESRSEVRIMPCSTSGTKPRSYLPHSPRGPEKNADKAQETR
jgi:hypothetical protein